jgi:hypothetical protein
MATGAVVSLRLTFVRRRLSYLSPWVLVKCRTFRPLLITLYSHDDNTPAQDRSQLGVAELVKGAVVADRRVDYLHGLAFETIGDLSECPTSGDWRISTYDEWFLKHRGDVRRIELVVPSFRMALQFVTGTERGAMSPTGISSSLWSTPMRKLEFIPVTRIAPLLHFPLLVCRMPDAGTSRTQQDAKAYSTANGRAGRLRHKSHPGL